MRATTTAPAIASAVLLTLVSRVAHAQRTRDPLLPDQPRPTVIVGDVVPTDAITSLRVRGLGGDAPVALRLVEPAPAPNATSVACLTPCSLTIAPSRYRLFVETPPARSDRGAIDVPLAGGTLLVDIHNRAAVGSGLVAGGLLTLVLGIITTTVGFWEATHPMGFDFARAGAWLPVGIAFDVSTGVLLGFGGWIARTYRTRIEP